MKADENTTVGDLMKEVPRTGNRYLNLVTGELLGAIPSAAPEEPKDEPKKYTEDELKAMKMKELRKIGAPLGAADTKKSELIDEIIAKQ